jgi:hypothetical protein
MGINIVSTHNSCLLWSSPRQLEEAAIRAEGARLRDKVLYVPHAIVIHDHQCSFEVGAFGRVCTANRVCHWLLLLNRHASPLQRLGFYFAGALISMAQLIFREFGNSNGAAIKGVFGALFHSVRKSSGSSHANL